MVHVDIEVSDLNKVEFTHEHIPICLCWLCSTSSKKDFHDKQTQYYTST